MTATKDRLFFIWVTAFYPWVDHAVADEEMAARTAESRGEYQALCGAAFLPAPDDRPPGRRCPSCIRFVHARSSQPRVEQRLGQPDEHRPRHARPGWWARVCGHRHSRRRHG